MSASPFVQTTLALLFVLQVVPAAAQDASPAASYIVGAQDVLTITSYDQTELTGKFTVETDGSFTYPLVGRVQVGGMTLRAVEDVLRKALVAGGYFKEPQLTVAIDQYRSQKVYVVGEVRTPGAYPLSGDMRLIEALALAGFTTQLASGDVVIVHASSSKSLLVQSPPDSTGSPEEVPGAADTATRVDLHELEQGDLSQNARLAPGDTVFVLRAENVYVFGQVKSPGAYPLRQKQTTVLQALSLAGGVSDRASTGRIQIVRIVNDKKVQIRAGLSDLVMPRDTIIVPERFF